MVFGERADTGILDFDAALPDFSVLSIRPSSQTRWVNGRRSSQTSWQLSLAPRRTGRLRIPAFQLRNQQTRPIEIQVDTAPQGPENGAPFSASLRFDREAAFVGEQILATLSLSAERGIGSLQGSALEVDGGDVTLVSQREFQRVIAGAPFQVTELVYAIFAQRPGPLVFESFEFRGARRRGSRVIARTQPQTLPISPPPSGPDERPGSAWFPASGVALASEWSARDKVATVGEPITRTLRIAAAGQRAAAILPLDPPTGNFKQYPEKPDLNDTETSTGILGTRTESVVLVPTQPGELKLPPIAIDWWNIETRQWEVARIPADRLEVRPADPTVGDLTSPAAPDGAASRNAARPAAGEAFPEPAPLTPASRAPSIWKTLTVLLGLLSLGLGAGCWHLWQRMRDLESRSATASPGGRGADGLQRAPSERGAYSDFQTAAEQQQLAEARQALLAWARVRWPDREVRTLQQLAEAAAPETRDALRALDAALYGENEIRTASGFDWAGLGRAAEALRRADDAPADPNGRKRAADASEQSALPELYP